MGMKSIWDGVDLPPVGCEVLIHLARPEVWVRHVVTGHKVRPGNKDERWLYVVDVVVGPSDDPRSHKNERFLSDCKPLDWREPV